MIVVYCFYLYTLYLCRIKHMGLEITYDFIVAMETFTFPINTIIHNLTTQETEQVNNIKLAEMKINTDTNFSRSYPSKVIT